MRSRIACDSSVLIAYYAGERGAACELLDEHLVDESAYVPLAVVTEMLSAKIIPDILKSDMKVFPKLEILPGFWERAAANRRTLLIKNLKAKLADTLIAQSCIDYDIPLLTLDEDFQNFAKHCGLRLVSIPC